MSCTMRWRTTSRLGQVHEGEALDAAEHRLEPEQPERPPATSIWVTSPVTTTFEPKPMRVRNIFICSGVVFCASSRMMKLLFERPAPHEGERRHLDSAPLEQPLGALGLEHVVERVVERAQVGVDLGHEVAGQEAESLPGLDGGAGQDDAVDLLGLEGLDGQGHGQIRLAGARRADAEGDVLAAMASA